MRADIIVGSLLGLVVTSLAHATGIPDSPLDVEEFIDRREICDHFRGEEPYDEERAKFLAEQIEKACSGTDKELRALKQKYKDNDKIMQILNRFEERVESKNGS